MLLEWRIGEMEEHGRRRAKTLHSPTGQCSIPLIDTALGFRSGWSKRRRAASELERGLGGRMERDGPAEYASSPCQEMGSASSSTGLLL
jgi:hypothetical protein